MWRGYNEYLALIPFFGNGHSFFEIVGKYLIGITDCQ